MLTVHFLVRKNPQEEKMSSPRFSLSSLASFLIRNDMTNFVYSCKPTQNSPRCISLDLESNFSFLISSAPYLPQSPDQFLMIQYFKRLLFIAISRILRFIFGQNEVIARKGITTKFKKVNACIEWLISPFRSHP